MPAMRSMPDATPRANSTPAGAKSDLAADLALCQADERLFERLRDIYARLEAEIDDAGVDCHACGRCCYFESIDHRLFVSTGELALLVSEPPGPGYMPLPLRCRYQVGPQCTARDRRPLGCRVFFCSQGAWCAETYEKHHRDIRAAHDERRLPYRYVELTATIAELFSPRDISVDRPRADP